MFFASLGLSRKVVHGPSTAVARCRISAVREHSEPTHTSPRGRTAAAEAVRIQCLGWERPAGLYLLLCFGGLSCACPVVRSLLQSPRTISSSSGWSLWHQRGRADRAQRGRPTHHHAAGQPQPRPCAPSVFGSERLAGVYLPCSGGLSRACPVVRSRLWQDCYLRTTLTLRLLVDSKRNERCHSSYL